MPWTADQLTAIESRGENLLVSAAAGSGKTTVLVERVLRLIGEGADIGNMLIVTFTRAAASDMRASLIRALEKAALTQPRFRAQAEAAEWAGISTIHSFCIDILREHFQKAGVDPAFRVADAAEAAILMSKALDAAMNAAYEAASPDLIALSEGRPPDQVRELAEQLYRFILDRPEPFRWLEGAVHRLETGEDVFSPVLARAAKRPLSDALALAREGAALCQGSDFLAPYLRTAEADRALVEALLPLDYEPLQQALAAPSFARLPVLKGAKDDPAALAFRALREDVKKLVKKAGEKLPLALAPAREDLVESAREVRALSDIVSRLDAEYTRLKDERGLLTFGDLEHRALRALEDEGVRAALRERYTHVFVDEYQDVSDIQEAIVRRIARADNLFCVGDVKQSIYRFRNAEPSLFQAKYERYGRGEGGRLVLLNQNFRSRAGILRFTNAVFARAMRGGDSEITYDEDAFLRPGAAYEGQDPPVELYLVGRDGSAPEPEDDPAARLILDMKDAEVEALIAARRIQELVGTPTWDVKKGAFRPLQYRDFVLLTRTARDVAPLMLSILKREGIPAYADVSGGYLDVVEVRVAVALLRLIENHRRDIEWIAVLRSPVMNLTSEQLAAVRLAAPEGRFCDAVAARAAGDDELALRLRSLSHRLARWREQSNAQPLSAFVFGVLRESGLYASVGALPGGAQRQANLDILCDRAGGYEAAQAGGLTGFLNYLEAMSVSREDMGEAHVLGENDDVVRVMTVHKSKGLEFPVVFGVMLGRPWGSRASRGEMKAHRLLGVGLKHVDNRLGSRRDTLSRLAAAEQAGLEAEAEEMRILYVLLTRARDRLILTGSAPDVDRLVRRAAVSARVPLTPGSFLELILPALLKMPGAESLGAGLPVDPEAPKVAVHALTRAALSAQESEETTRSDALLDEALAALPDEGLLAAYRWKYPYADSVMLPLKLTASGLSRELTGPAQPPELIERPAFLSGEAMTGAERGTAAHAALQHLRLDALRGLSGDALHAEIVRQLNDMAERVLITPAMREAVRPRMLADFFAKGPGARMLNAATLRREWMFTLSLPAREAVGADSDEIVLVQGSIDCCFMEDGQWVLLDYKTDRTDDEDQLRRRYEPQLRLYALALNKITGVPVKETLICLLRSGRVIGVSC